MSSGAVEQKSLPAAERPVLQDLYRVLLLQKNGSELLVSGERLPFTLPCAEIPRWERVAENMIAAVRKRYGISAICLFTPELPAVATDGEQARYLVMETRETGMVATEETQWLPTGAFSGQSFEDRQDFVAITAMLRQIAEFQNGEAFGPFGKPGWIEDLSSWVQREIEPHGLRLNGKVRQFNASPTFALLQFETNGQAVWFKAVGDPNLREFPISVAVSNLFRGFVPTLIATHLAWNGWLTTEFPGSTLEQVSDASACVLAARTLAELQVASVEKTDQLIEAGCRDLRVASLLELVDPFLEVISRLMGQQQSSPPPFLSTGELRLLGLHIKETLTAWAQLDIPDTLGHLDFNPGNILCSAKQCVFLDWAEAYVGPPFLTLEYLREHLVRLRKEALNLKEDVIEPYEAAWRRIVSSEGVSAALDLAPILAAFAYAVGTDAWQNSARLRDPKIAGYLRSLTRRMHREMQRVQNRGVLCRN
jgi:hypothetical protein